MAYTVFPLASVMLSRGNLGVPVMFTGSSKFTVKVTVSELEGLSSSSV